MYTVYTHLERIRTRARVSTSCFFFFSSPDAFSFFLFFSFFSLIFPRFNSSRYV